MNRHFDKDEEEAIMAVLIAQEIEKNVPDRPWSARPRSLVGDLAHNAWLELEAIGYGTLPDASCRGATPEPADMTKCTTSRARRENSASEDLLLDVYLKLWKEDRSLRDTSGINPQVIVNHVDGYLRHCLDGPYQERDYLIFWLHFLDGMSAIEIAALPALGLDPRGVEEVIQRLERTIREQIFPNSSRAPDGDL